MNGREAQIRAAMQFTAWLQKYSPELHAALMERVGEAPRNGALNQLADSWDMLSGLGQDVDPFGGVGVPTTTTTTGDSSWDWAKNVLSEGIEAAKQIVPQVLQYQTQQQILDMNIERAKQGLPPIDPGVVAPQVKVIHDVAPEYRPAILAGANMGNMLLWGGLALGAFMLVRMLR